MCPFPVGIDPLSAKMRTGASRRAGANKSNKAMKRRIQRSARMCAKPVEQSAYRDDLVNELQEHQIVRPQEEWGPTTFTSQRLASTLGNKRKHPSQPEKRLLDRLRRRRSERVKKEGNPSRHDVRTGRTCSVSHPVPTRSPYPTRQDSIEKLACPYLKFDASKYSCCLSVSLENAAAVRQHIETTHRRAGYCPRCYTEFTGEGASNNRRDHIMARRCQLDPGPNTVEGLHGDLMDRLREWEPVVGWPLREQWEEIWKIVFPESPAPSTPFLEERDMDGNGSSHFCEGFKA